MKRIRRTAALALLLLLTGCNLFLREPIRMGMSSVEVRKAWGYPSRTSVYESGGGRTTFWHYRRVGFRSAASVMMRDGRVVGISR